MTTNVDTKNIQWLSRIYDWTTVRDAQSGESTIKFKSSMYLPIPAAMLNLPPAPSVQKTEWHTLAMPEYAEVNAQLYNPNAHQIAAYESYKTRARFPNLVSFLYRGLMGLASADSPAISLPDEMQYLINESATPEGLNLQQLFAKTLGEVLLLGRYVHVLDPIEAQNGNPERIQIVDYRAEQFINWRTARRVPILNVFNERVVDEQSSIFVENYKDTYITQELRDNIYVSEFYASSGTEPVLSVPNFRGKTLDFLPFTVYGALNNTLNVDPPPMGPVANTSIQIYQKDADLAQSEYLTCNPTLIITGATTGGDSSDGTIATGPTVAMRITNPQAKVYYTQTDTSALEFILSHLTILYEQAVVYGAQLLDSSKKSAESAETTRLRQTAASATLKSVVVQVGQGFEQTLKMAAYWMGLSEAAIAEISFKPITEFGVALTPQEQEQLVQSWLSGAISHNTVLTNFRKAGILPKGVTEDKEIENIGSEKPTPITEIIPSDEGTPAGSVRVNV